MIRKTLRHGANLVRDVCTYPLFHWSHRPPWFLRVAGLNVSRADRFRGVFPSYASAAAALPKHLPQGFDSEVAPDYWMQSFGHFRKEDYPVLVWLTQILRPGDTVFDLGGGYGQSYYAYSEYIQLPADLRWVVCDVESFTAAGERIAAERGNSTLAFTTHWNVADGARVFLTNGTLQYIEQDLSEIIGALKKRPEHVIVNRVPAHDGKPFYTVQSGHVAYCAYKVMNSGEFVRSMEQLGYRMVDEWSIPRKLRVPFHHEVSSYRGFYFAQR